MVGVKYEGCSGNSLRWMVWIIKISINVITKLLICLCLLFCGLDSSVRYSWHDDMPKHFFEILEKLINRYYWQLSPKMNFLCIISEKRNTQPCFFFLTSCRTFLFLPLDCRVCHWWSKSPKWQTKIIQKIKNLVNFLYDISKIFLTLYNRWRWEDYHQFDVHQHTL